MDDYTGKPLLRIYGITENGNSILAIVKDFYPYFYIDCPQNFTIENHKEKFINYLESILSKKFDQNIKNVIDIHICKKINIFHFSKNEAEFIKITLLAPKMVSFLREYFEESRSFGDLNFSKQTYESKVNFPLRYMIDNGLQLRQEIIK